MKKEAKQQIVPLNISIVATCLQEVTDEKAVQLCLPSRDPFNKLSIQKSITRCQEYLPQVNWAYVNLPYANLPYLATCLRPTCPT